MMRRPRPLSDISLATRLSLVALAVTLVSLTVTATVGLVRGSQLADEITDDRLVTIAASRATSIEIYVTTVEREIAALATSPATREAIRELGVAYRELNVQDLDPAATEDLAEYYLTEIVPALEQLRGDRVGAEFIVPEGPGAVYLQSAYTVPEGDEDEAGIAPELVLDPGDGSSYSAAHPGVHQTFAGFAARSGFDDLYLIDARDDVILYSTLKRIDFATSLDLGPHSGSALARLVDNLEADPTIEVQMTDLAPYLPARERPTAFVASPVRDGGVVVGYLAAALPVDTFDAILAGDGSQGVFGDTGDVYIVGTDGIMRTTTRAYVESPSAYLAAATEPGPAELSAGDRRRIAETGTTALVQPVDRRLADAAAEGPGLTDTINHRGVEVRTAYRPIAVDGVEWQIFAEVDRSELDRPIADYARDILFAVALFVVVVTFIAVRWADRLMAPIRAIAARLRSVRSPTAEATAPADIGKTGGPDEYAELSDSVEQMLERLSERQAAVEARSAERAALLQQFLPAAIARRSEESDGEVVDHVRQASVIVMSVDGVGDLVGARPEQEVRDLVAELVDDVDALAAENGIERIKMTGATYYAVCGVGRPYLDHALRAVNFGLATRDLLDEIAGAQLSVRGGIAAGEVSVGLASRSALVYDVWGDTVAQAEQLARTAMPGAIVVSDAVRRQLPTEFDIDEAAADGSVTVTSRSDQQGTPA